MAVILKLSMRNASRTFDDVIVLCDTLNQYINLSYKRKVHLW